ncbi:MAG: hypothetical protein RR677_12835, partial [Acinetobacter sp.]
LCASNCFAVNPDQEYMMFLKKYEELSNLVDIEGLEMYADDAKIHAKGVAFDGIERSMSMSGKKLKEVNLENIEVIKKMGYQINFNNVKIIRGQNSTKITASKYSNEKCFTDNDYYMVVTKKADNKLYITEESITVPEQNFCKESIKNDLALQLSLGANMMRKNLPMQVDRETNFENISAQDKQLTMVFRLIHFTSDDISKDFVEMNFVPEIIQNVCKDKSKKDLLEKGAQFNLNYYFSDNTPLVEIKMTKQDCSI